MKQSEQKDAVDIEYNKYKFIDNTVIKKLDDELYVHPHNIDFKLDIGSAIICKFVK